MNEATEHLSEQKVTNSNRKLLVYIYDKWLPTKCKKIYCFI